MTDWKKWIVLIYKIWGIKQNIDFQTLDSTYLWCDCQDIWRTNIKYLLLQPFEWLHLWRNYITKRRTIIINTLLWIKMMSLNYHEISTYENPCKTEELNEHACKGMKDCKISKNEKQSFLWELIFLKLKNINRFW